MFALVVVVKVYFVSVVVIAVAPVAVPSKVPAALFRFNFARGKIVPELAVFLTQSANVIVAPAGMVPVDGGVWQGTTTAVAGLSTGRTARLDQAA